MYKLLLDSLKEKLPLQIKKIDGNFLCGHPIRTFTGSGLDGIFDEVSAKSKSLNLSNFFLVLLHKGLNFTGMLKFCDKISGHPK